MDNIIPFPDIESDELNPSEEDHPLPTLADWLAALRSDGLTDLWKNDRWPGWIADGTIFKLMSPDTALRLNVSRSWWLGRGGRV
jgi:hypothetical protein